MEQISEERILLAVTSERVFSNIVNQLIWPKTEVLLFLKARSRVISLHDLSAEEKILKRVPYEVIFEDLLTDEGHPSK